MLSQVKLSHLPLLPLSTKGHWRWGYFRLFLREVISSQTSVAYLITPRASTFCRSLLRWRVFLRQELFFGWDALFAARGRATLSTSKPEKRRFARIALHDIYVLVQLKPFNNFTSLLYKIGLPYLKDGVFTACSKVISHRREGCTSGTALVTIEGVEDASLAQVPELDSRVLRSRYEIVS